MSSTSVEEPAASVLLFQRALGRLVLGQNGKSAAWEEPSLRGLARLMLLPANWDSYGARPIDPACVWSAWRLLTGILRAHSPAPSVVPTARGGVQLEWHRNGIDLEIEVAGPRHILVSFEEERAGKSWEMSGAIDPVELAAAIDQLSTGGAVNGRDVQR